MSKHHQHPHEGHSAGNPPKSHLRHNWFFYLSGILILIALLAFIASGNLSWNFNTAAPQPKPIVGGAK
jgi:hypothetical protein